MEEIKKIINNDKQIIKFCFYGFLKNLKFFEPFLLLFLLSRDLNLFMIGLLISVREIVINVFEIPSGLIADYFGRKKELYFCFLFYIISFIFFFFTNSFFIALFAMIFFGLGEAFRSGTHKAIIFTYLEQKNWTEYKSYVYGKTRAMSLTGSAISSLVSIYLILNIPNLNYIFLFSVIPYIIDFVLIASYPKDLDQESCNIHGSLMSFMKLLLKRLKNNGKLKFLLISDGLFEAAVTSMKDLVQPILSLLFISSSIYLFKGLSPDENVKVMLGLLYFVINIFGVFSSRNSYRVTMKFDKYKVLNFVFILLCISFFLIGVLDNILIFVCILFILVNMLRDFRKPVFIDCMGDNMEKAERATMFSVASQLKSFFVIIIAPVVGYISDKTEIRFSFIVLSIFLILIYELIKVFDKSSQWI